MNDRILSWALCAVLTLLLAAAGPSIARADHSWYDWLWPNYRQDHHHHPVRHLGHHIGYAPNGRVLRRERHVIEGFQPSLTGRFLINGTWYTGTRIACANWVPGDRIRVLAREPQACPVILVRNLSRGYSCKMVCGTDWD